MQKNDKTMIRVKRRENPYVTLDKTGLNDERLSWKAKGLLCYLLSLPDDWQIYVNELKNHSSDGRDSTASALNELIKYGYSARERTRDERGRMKGYIYTVFEIPIEVKTAEIVENTAFTPETENPFSVVSSPETENPFSVNPFSVNPNTENPKLLNNNYTNQPLLLNNNSINLSDANDKIDKTTIYNYYKQIINDNINYEVLKNDFPHEQIIDDIFLLLVDTISSDMTTIRIAKEDKPLEVVKSVFLKLNKGHIEYVLESMRKNTTKVENIKSYLLTTLYNAPMTINTYYSNLVNHDMYGGM